MKKNEDRFEGKKIYSYEYFSPLGEPKEEKRTEEGKIPNCVGSVTEIINKSRVIRYEGGVETSDCGCGNHKIIVEAEYEFFIKTNEPQLVDNRDMSRIKVTVCEKTSPI